MVSPSGDDTNPGTSDRPVASLKRAVELSRALPAGIHRRIVMKAGEYFDTNATLTPQDSGLTIESAPGKPAVLIGGVKLFGWQKDGDKFWSAVLPAGRSWDVRLLQVNGRFCPRARFPENGKLTHLSRFDVPWMSSTGGGWKRQPTADELTTLKYKKGDLPANLDVHNAEVTVFHMWDESVAGISSQDAVAGTLKLTPPLGHPGGAFGVNEYCLWNIREGMTAPGQWFFDRSRNQIVYWPMAGEELSKAAAIVPTQRTILGLRGAKNVTLRNFNLAVTTVLLVTGGFAAGAFDGAIQLERADGAVLSGLQITNVAGHAIKAMHAQNSMLVDNCQISFCGAGGIYVEGSKNTVNNNLIHDVGLMFPSALGINGGGTDSRLSHNELHDTSYSAIDFGGKNILMEYNHIYRCMKVLHDGAAIYTFGSRGTVIRNNYAHDIVDTGGYGASAYYLDEQSQDCVVENNVSVNVARPSHNHMARNNTLRNNVFITTGDMRLTFPKCSAFTMQGNVLYATGSVTFEGINFVSKWSKNVVYSGAGSVKGINLDGYSATTTVSGLAGDTQAANPLFVDLPELNLQYRPESPALKLGLKAVDVSHTGRK